MLTSLTKIGLSDNEAKVYLALLDLGNATAQQIAQKAGVNRPTTYVQLESLIKLGLVSTFEKESEKTGNAKTYFRAEDPEHLKKIVERERTSVEEKESLLSDALPELATLFVTRGERPRVRFFDGIEGLFTMLDEFLKTKDTLVENISSLDDAYAVFPDHIKTYGAKRVARGIHAKMLYTRSEGKLFKQVDTTALREARFIPPNKFPLSVDLAIYGNSVAISTLKPKERPYGIVIESAEVAKSFRSFFYLAWEAAEKYNTPDN